MDLGSGRVPISRNTGFSDGLNLTPEKAANSRSLNIPGMESSDKTNLLKNTILPQRGDSLAQGELADLNVKILHVAAETPTLLLPDLQGSLQTLRAILEKLLEDFQLPRSPALINKLSHEAAEKVLFKVQNQVTETSLNASFLHNEMKGFFDLLTKLYPLCLGIASNMLEGKNSQNLTDQASNMLKELLVIAQNTLNGSELPNSIKENMLAKLQEIQALLATNSSASGDKVGNLLQQLQQMSGSGQGISQQLNSIFTLLQHLRSVSSQEQLLSLQSALTTNAESSGNAISNMSNELGQLIQGSLEKLSGQRDLDAKGQLYSQAFKQAILSGSLLGASLISGEMREHNAQFAAQVASTKIDSLKNLGIMDLIPFSFLAFFPDLRDHSRGDPDVYKAAKAALMKLVRILMQLLFLLSAIASAGNNLGKAGMHTLLDEQTDLILHQFDTLSFALKKVDEIYGVSVSFQLAAVQHAKESLIKKDYDQFWRFALGIFSAETELTSFLQDIEDAKPLFHTLKEMLKEPSQLLGSEIPM